MGKTYRDNVIWPRSISFKSEHNRGWAREKDRHSHHSQRNMNHSCDELTFVPFGREFKRENVFELQVGTNVYNSSLDLNTFAQDHKDICDWNKMPIKQCLQKVIQSKHVGQAEKKYAKDSLRQFQRRGAAGHFKGHDKFSEKYVAVIE
jgi:hypothetical protein